MRGLVPRIHVNSALKKDVDTRDKRGHDVGVAADQSGPFVDLR